MLNQGMHMKLTMKWDPQRLCTGKTQGWICDKIIDTVGPLDNISKT